VEYLRRYSIIFCVPPQFQETLLPFSPHLLLIPPCYRHLMRFIACEKVMFMLHVGMKGNVPSNSGEI
jgi:hypothetical protein